MMPLSPRSARAEGPASDKYEDYRESGDRIAVKTQSARTHDLIPGLTQLLDPRTSVAVKLSRDRATGYLSDSYKLVQKSTGVASGVFLR